jgi:hypothetical protein
VSSGLSTLIWSDDGSTRVGGIGRLATIVMTQKTHLQPRLLAMKPPITGLVAKLDGDLRDS